MFLEMECGEKVRKVGVFLCVIFIILMCYAGMAGASESSIPVIGDAGVIEDINGRITKLKCSSEKSLGYPVIDGDFIVWSEQIGTAINPCYYKISDNKVYVLDGHNTNNGEKLQLSQGVLIYSTYSTKYLTLVNLSDEVRFGLEPGESREFTDQGVSAFYRLNEDYIVFLVTTKSDKECYVISHNEPTPMMLFNADVNDIRISKYEGQNIILWRDKIGHLHCYNLNDNTTVQLNDDKCKATYFSIYGDEVVYFTTDKNSKLFHQKVSGAKTELDIGAQPNAICLAANYLYYVQDNKICRYDMNTGQSKEIIMLHGFPQNISSNGNDIVFKVGNRSYWYAGIKNVQVTIVDNCNTVKVGEKINLQAVATFSNGGSAEVTSGATWNSSDEGVVTWDETGLYEALSPGIARITVEYEGVSDFIDIEVIEESKIVINPPQPEPLPNPSHNSGSGYSNGIVYNTETGAATNSWSMPLNSLYAEMSWGEKGKWFCKLMMPYQFWLWLD